MVLPPVPTIGPVRSEDDAGVAVTVLGEVAVHDDDRQEIPLAPQKREILAALAAAAGATVPTDALLHALWSEATPATRRRLVSQVNQLRPLLSRGLAIEHRNGGYRLVGPLELLDATRFEALVTSARELPPAAAAARHAAALRLWRRDTPFSNVGNPLVDAAARRLLLLRDDVVLALADAEIAQRCANAAPPHLEQLLLDDPTRGDVARRLALLLSFAERDVDALRAIERHRDALTQIGAVLAPELAAIEARILRHEPADADQPGTGAPWGGTTGSGSRRPAGWLVRRALLERVEQAVAQRPVLLVGEPGVGKTELTRQLEQHLDVTGGAIVVRADVAREPQRPMDVVASLAEQLRASFPTRMRDALHDAGIATALAQVAPGLAARTDRATGPTTRDALVTDLTRLIVDVVREAGALVVVEDAHWLDASSADVVAGLVAAGIRVLLTSRPAVPAILADAGAAGRLEVIEVPPFGADEVDDLLRQVLPLRASEALAAELLRQTGGNALFLGLSLDVLAHGELGDDVPATLQRAVDERTAGLSRAAREVLQLAALLGRTFPIEPLRRLRPRALDALRAAEDEGLVQLDGDRATGRFAHGLVADALASTVPAGIRPAMHDELCRALQAGAHGAVAVGLQAVAAAELDPWRAATCARDAAAEHAAVFAWAQVVDVARRGLDVVERFAMARTSIEAELRLHIGTALRRSSRGGSDHELLLAAEIAQEAGDLRTYATAVTEACLHGPTSLAGGVDERVRTHLERALALELDPAARIELLSAAAILMAFSDQSERGRLLYLEARERARALGDARLLRSVTMNAHLGLARPDDVALRAEAAHDLAALPDAESQWEASFLSFGLGLIRADRDLVDRSFEHLQAWTPSVVERERSRGLQQIAAAHAFVRGDLDAAERLAGDALTTALATYPESWSMSIYAALLLPIREAQGRQGELWPVVTTMLQATPRFLAWHAVAASAAYALGDRAGMAAEVAVLREHDLEFARDLTFTAAATITARPIWALGDRELARRAYDQLLPFAGQMTWNGLSTHGPVDAGLALLAATLGDEDHCQRHARTAGRLVEQLGAPHLWWPELDRCCRGLGQTAE